MKYLIANWKMKLAPKGELALAKKIARVPFNARKLSVILAPTFLSIERIRAAVKNTSILLAGQNCFWERAGAYTGEVSPFHLKAAGCTHVIIGHSERRTHLLENTEQVTKKVRAAIDEMLTPILCVGESLEERERGVEDHAVLRQIETALEGVELIGDQKLLIAYEPVWAIGTGRAARLPEIVYMHQVIFQALIDAFPRHVVERNTAILYGGSVDGGNIEELCKENKIQGALVGSASVNPEEVAKIIATILLYA